MVAFERLLEALVFAQDNGSNWWEEFSSIKEAKQILSKSARHKPDEYETIQLADVLDQDYPSSDYELDKVFTLCLSLLKKQLGNNR